VISDMGCHIFDGSFILRAILIKFDHLGLLGLLSIKFDLLSSRLNMNDLVNGVD
jgi:hypothetical protein